MTPLDREGSDPSDVAAAFFSRVRSGECSDADRAALEAWLAASPEHRRAYRKTQALWAGLDPIRADPTMLALREEARRGLFRRRASRYLGAAAALVMAIGGVGLGLHSLAVHRQRPDTAMLFETPVGQLASVALPDGSAAVLDTNSAIRVWELPHLRRVELLRGRALFKVHHDTSRPFVVEAAGRSVTAVGTEFDVYLRQSAVEVGLVEGRVRVEQGPPAPGSEGPPGRTARVELTAGHRLTVSAAGWAVAPMDAAEPTWLSRQLVFDEAPLSEIAAELNRYSPRKIVIADRQAGLGRMSAVLRSDDPVTFIASVRSLGLGRVTETPSGYVVRAP